MRQNLKILGTRELKPILKFIREHWNAAPPEDIGWLLTAKDKIYLISRDMAKIDTKNLRVTAVGMYFGEWKNNELRLSIEGSQLIGPSAKKNIVDLTNEEKSLWIKGTDLEKETKEQGFVIIRYNDDFIGCGKVKENRILNFVPKARRLLQE